MVDISCLVYRLYSICNGKINKKLGGSRPYAYKHKVSDTEEYDDSSFRRFKNIKELTDYVVEANPDNHITGVSTISGSQIVHVSNLGGHYRLEMSLSEEDMIYLTLQLSKRRPDLIY